MLRGSSSYGTFQGGVPSRFINARAVYSICLLGAVLALSQVVLQTARDQPVEQSLDFGFKSDREATYANGASGTGLRFLGQPSSTTAARVEAEQADPNSADSAQAGYDAPLGTFALAEAQLNNFHAVQPVSSLAQVQSQGQQLEANGPEAAAGLPQEAYWTHYPIRPEGALDSEAVVPTDGNNEQSLEQRQIMMQREYEVEHNVQAEQPRVPSVVSQFAVDPEQRAELGSLQATSVAAEPQRGAQAAAAEPKAKARHDTAHDFQHTAELAMINEGIANHEGVKPAPPPRVVPPPLPVPRRINRPIPNEYHPTTMMEEDNLAQAGEIHRAFNNQRATGFASELEDYPDMHNGNAAPTVMQLASSLQSKFQPVEQDSGIQDVPEQEQEGAFNAASRANTYSYSS